VRDEVAVVSLSVLDHTEDATYPDEERSGVESVQVALPDVAGSRLSGVGGSAEHATVEECGHDDEAGEEEDLHGQTADDHVLSQCEGGDGAAGHDAAAYRECELDSADDDQRRTLDSPAPCRMKEMTSPMTKNLVNHFRGTIAYFSPSVRRMIRPRLM
jgi:hypothetical protein